MGTRRATERLCDGIAIEHGTRDDYETLARFHYRAGLPATIVSVLRARAGRTTIGVLVVSMPTLNSSWRDVAWPGRFQSGSRARDAKAINDDLRTISRVVVDPRWRGLGLASELVRSYLRRPLTPATEAVAVMGGVCPFFVRAGMSEFVVPPSSRDRRLLDELRALGTNPRDLVDLDRLRPRLRRSARLRAAIERWAKGSKATRKQLASNDSLAMLAVRAASAARPTLAYAHAQPGARVPQPVLQRQGDPWERKHTTSIRHPRAGTSSASG